MLENLLDIEVTEYGTIIEEIEHDRLQTEVPGPPHRRRVLPLCGAGGEVENGTSVYHFH